MAEHASTQKLSFVEKAGYSGADAAANFVFMTMILFQANFYTDVFGITAGTAGRHSAVAATVGRLLRSDRWASSPTAPTRAGASSAPGFCGPPCPGRIVMVLAYTTPNGWSTAATDRLRR